MRALPKVDALIELAKDAKQAEPYTHAELLSAARAVVDGLRQEVLAEQRTGMPTRQELQDLVLDTAKEQAVCLLRPAVNATGIVLHTNLGRAPLAASVARHVGQVAAGYSTLEYDVETGGRGSRHAVVESLICRLTGAQAAMVVNNNAAAVLLALAASCKGKEVVVSRGELVEIGGSFRVPEVLEQSGAVLREVGTTNKTRLADYEDAILPEITGGLLKVHTSNFKVVGFTETVEPEALAELGRRHGLPLIYDLGSGLLADPGLLSGVGEEPAVWAAAASGADVVTFSGDKLLGGPQAGIAVGTKAFINSMKSHPLARALRIDKLSLAALEATLRLYLSPEKAVTEIPALAAIALPEQALRERAESLCALLNSDAYTASVVSLESQVGGGSVPGQDLPSYGIAVQSTTLSAGQIDERLRRREVPVIGRISKDRYLMDVRTLPPETFELIADAFRDIFTGKE